MRRHDDFDLHGCGAGDESVKVIDLKPKEDAVAVGFPVAVADGEMIVVDVETVELEDELAVGGKAFVFVAAVGALATEELLVPEATGLDAGDGEERLGAHTGWDQLNGTQSV